MKKIVSIALCLAFCILALASCGEKEIGSYLKNYDYEPKNVEELTLNFYIICDDLTTKNSKDTIGRELSQYTKDKFNTKLNVFYTSQTEYDEIIAQKTKVGAENRADIILINSENMMKSLTTDKSKETDYLLADLTDYYNGRTYGKLNVKIASDILEASKINGKYYCVPNNHIVGDNNANGVMGDYGYEYIVIDEAIARAYGFGDTKTLSTYTSVDALMAEGGLGRALVNAGKLTYDEEHGTVHCTCSEGKCVEVVNAGFSAQKEFVDNGKYFTVSKTPTATAADAFSSAFAVVKGTKDVSRAMEIIYALNTNIELRNLLQYGVKGTNYDMDEEGNITRVSPDDTTRSNSVYYMNILYTGDIFAASYCSELDWTKETMENAASQNKKCVISQDVYQP